MLYWLHESERYSPPSDKLKRELVFDDATRFLANRIGFDAASTTTPFVNIFSQLRSSGNGVITSGEECDDGNNTTGDGCDDTCVLEVCGNGKLQAGEECDDGNQSNHDGCDDDVANGGNCTPTACGNGVTTAGETTLKVEEYMVCENGYPKSVKFVVVP